MCRKHLPSSFVSLCLLALLLCAVLGCAATDEIDQAQPPDALYFESPEKAVPVITDLVRKNDWLTLTRYYDLAGTSLTRAELETGAFFIETETPKDADPNGFWRYKHPFPPLFKFDHVQATNDPKVAIVVMAVEIDQGGGPPQRGLTEFQMKHSPNGWQILPPEQKPVNRPKTEATNESNK